GTFATPQLLMLSGIGPTDHLTANGVQGLRDENGRSVCENINLPGVGQNLGDRYEASVISEADPEWPSLAKASLTPPVPDEAFELWKRSRGGIYATNGGVIGILHKSSIRRGEEAASANINHLTGRPHRLAPDLFMMGFPAAF